MKKVLLSISLLVLILCMCACEKEHIHAFSEWETLSNPTCTETGLRERYCPCGETESSELPASGHSYGEWIVDSEVSCYSDGERHIECTVCKETVKTETIPGGHSFGEWVIQSEATCTADGLKSNFCSVCSETVEEIIPATGHTVEIIEKGFAATCTEPGKTDGKVCSVCNEVISKSEVIEAPGHNWVGEKCSVCKCDRYYVAGEMWIVEGEWEFTIKSVKKHYLCNKYANNGYTNEQVVIVEYTYKNIGYENSIQDLYFSAIMDFEVYDEELESSESYACTHGKYPDVLVKGTKCTAGQGYVLINNSSEVTIFVEHITSYGKGKASAIFKIPVT